MDFFEKLSKKATETYKSAAEKTNKIASDTKLKLKISDIKSKIDDIYTGIGKKIYQEYVLDENISVKADVKEELEAIKRMAGEIEQLEEQRLDLSDMRQCPKCKNRIDKSAKFCPICGAEQPEEQHDAIEVEIKEQPEEEQQSNSEEAQSTEQQQSSEEAQSTSENCTQEENKDE